MCVWCVLDVRSSMPCHNPLVRQLMQRALVQARKALSKRKGELEVERHQVEKLQRKFSVIHKTLVAGASSAHA